VQAGSESLGGWFAWSQAVLAVMRCMLRSAAAACSRRTHLFHQRRLTVTDQRDVISQSTSGAVVLPTAGECQQPPGSCGETCNAACEDVTSPNDVSATLNDVSMTYGRGGGGDVTSYSVLSTTDVTELLQVSGSDSNDVLRQCAGLGDELREISRDLADIRACALTMSARCHDDEWRRGAALTLGVAEALTPLHSQLPRVDTSALTDWQLDQSALECESRDHRLTRAAELMTSSPADDSVTDFFIDDELDDVIV